MKRSLTLKSRRIKNDQKNIYAAKTLKTVTPKVNKNNFLEQLAIVWILLGYPLLSFLAAAFFSDSRLLSVPFRVLQCLLMWYLVYISFKLKNGSLTNKYFMFLMFFFGLYSVRLLWDTLIDPIELNAPAYEYLFFYWGISLPSFLAMYFFASKDTVQLAANKIVFIGSLICTLSFLPFFKTFWTEEMTRLSGNQYLNPITLGHVAATTLIAGLFQIMTNRIFIKHWLAKPLIFASIGLTAYTLLVAGSRAPFLVFVFCVSLMLVGFYWKNFNFHKILIGLSLVLLVGLAIIFAVKDSVNLTNRFLRAEAYTGGPSTAQRVEFIADAWDQFLDNPILGSAIVEKNSHLYPHNIVIEAFMATGLLGGICFTLVVFAATFKSVKQVFQYPNHSLAQLLFLQYFLASLTSGNIYYNPEFWGLLAFAIRKGGPDEASI